MSIETNFDIICEGKNFPTMDMMTRNAKYRLNESRLKGTYGDGKYLIIKDGRGNQKKLIYEMIKLNKFKLYTNKMVSLMFNRDPIIKTGDLRKDKTIYSIIEKTNWIDGIRRAVSNMESLGDGPIKTYSHGVSAFSPTHAFKIVNEFDINEVLAYVLVEYINNKDGVVSHVRFETHLKGYVHEIVYEYNGRSIGKQVEYKYRDRTISLGGDAYETGVDEFMVQWLACECYSIGGYGVSPYEDIAPLIHEAERRQTINMKILDAHSEPMLVVGAGILRENEETGKVEALDVLGNIVEVPNGGVIPNYVTWDGKLESSEKMLDLLFSEIYELTELGKTFMTGEYTGNISDESLNELVKSATDKANRRIWDIYYEVKKSLYVLCKLNGIDVTYEELNIVFRVGQTDGLKTVADVFNSRVEKGTISVFTGLQEYYEYNEEQAEDEVNRIKTERGGVI